MFYAIIGVILVGFWFISSISTKKNRDVFLLLSLFLLLLVMGLRGDFTIDYRNNQRVFNYYKDSSISQILRQDPEVLFAVIAKIIGVFSGSFIVFQFVLSALVCVPLFIAIKRNSVNYLLSVIFFYALSYYIESFNITRNGIAISFFLLGYTYIERQKFLKWLFCILVASLIHTSAIVLIPFYYLSKLKLNWKNLSITIIGAIIIVLNIESLIGLFQRITGLYLQYNGQAYGMWKREASIGNIVFFMIRFTIYASYFALLMMNPKLVDYKVYFAIFSAAVFAASYQIVMLYRYDLYIFGVFIFLFPNVFQKSNLTRLEKSLFTYIIIILSIIWVSYSYEGIYYPFWNNTVIIEGVF